MSHRIAILGGGNAGTAVALACSRHGQDVVVYSIEPDVCADINRNHRNKKYLPGIRLPRNIKAVGDIVDALKKTDLVVFAVPSNVLRDVAEQAASLITKGATIACITKGIDALTLQSAVSVLASSLPVGLRRRVCAIAGPAVATEMAEGKPTAIMLAGPELKSVRSLARSLQSDNLKVSISSDRAGAGYAMALKNIYAIALGMCDGLSYPMNTKALIMTLALDEMKMILAAVGATPETVYSLAGLGDLFVTGLSPHGRNRRYGESLVGSRTKEPSALGLTTVEGIAAASAGRKLIKNLRVKAPLLETVASCLVREHHFEKPFITYLKRLRLSSL